MGKYTITTGQNIYDVAMCLYGSIEGVVDLLINNPELSLDDTLKSGDELDYTDDFTISPDILAYNRMYGIQPANGERNVYPKEPSEALFMEIYLDSKRTSSSLWMSGNGTLEIDWGDNTELELFTLTNELQQLEHCFNDRIAVRRKIRLYGTVSLRLLDLSGSYASSVYILCPVHIEKFTCKHTELDLSFLSLAGNTYELNLTGVQTGDLSPLLSLKKLMRLDLTRAGLTSSVLDTYLKGLLKQHYGRRNLTVLLTTEPTGTYRKPDKDSNGNYLTASGMEAIWMLTHEPAWNEAGAWTFIINNQTYTHEPDDQGNL